MNTQHCFEDFSIGDVIPLGSKTMMREEVVAFAAEFDPQPFHLQEEAGKASLLGGLAASGWHTASAIMRMLCDTLLVNAACRGVPEVDDLRWMRPVLVGDTLTAQVEIVGLRSSPSDPELGLIDVLITVENQDGATVMSQRNPIVFERREIAQ